MSKDGVKRWRVTGVGKWRAELSEVVLATDHDRVVAEVESKLATARKMIAKLRQQRDWWCGIASRYGYTGPTGDDVEIEKIEKGDET